MFNVVGVSYNTRSKRSCWIEGTASVIYPHELGNEERQTNAYRRDESGLVFLFRKKKDLLIVSNCLTGAI